MFKYVLFRKIPFAIIITQLLLSFQSCEKTEPVENALPYCVITEPSMEEEIELGNTVPIMVKATDTDGYVTMVSFDINNVPVSCGSSNSLYHYWNTGSEDPGKYLISVSVVDNDGGSSIAETLVHLIEADTEKAPEAAFISSHSFVLPDFAVQFTDQSANAPSGWMWDFGDGSTSSLQNPSHAYSSIGSYTVSLKVTNSFGSDTVTKSDFISVTSTGIESGTVKDYDGNTYATVKIGSQWWMAENLRTTHYSGGAEIPLVESANAWTGQSIEVKAMCYYNNSSSNGNKYGALYTWAAAMNGSGSSSTNPSGITGACPSGWHVPSDDEWKQLESNLGMSQYAISGIGHRGTNEGSKLAGNSRFWKEGKLTANAAFGSSGFNGVPGGGRNDFGSFLYLGSHGAMWTSTAVDAVSVWGRCIYNDYSTVRRYNSQKQFAFAVRCVKN